MVDLWPLFGLVLLMTMSIDALETPTGRKTFHHVLEKVGKTVLRPGGSKATRKLLDWAALGPDSTVLELAAGLGYTSRIIVSQYGCKVLMTDTDESRLKKGLEAAKQSGLSEDRIEMQTTDMFDLSSLGDRAFDYIITEASVTHFAHAKKTDFFAGVSKHGGSFLLHEICYRTMDPERQKKARSDMSKALGIGFYPETVDGWKDLVTNAGFEVDHFETGPLAVLSPLEVMHDEGWNCLRIGWNLITQSELRNRVLTVRQTMSSYAEDLGFVILSASKKR